MIGLRISVEPQQLAGIGEDFRLDLLPDWVHPRTSSDHFEDETIQ